MSDDSANDVEADTGVGAPSIGEQLRYKEVLASNYIYEALCHPRRRYLCSSLPGDTKWSVTELATKIAAWESDIVEDEVSDHQRERVTVSLHHAHIPQVVDGGGINYCEASEEITPAENAERVLAALRGIRATLDSRQR